MIPHWLIDRKWFIFKKKKKTNTKRIEVVDKQQNQTHKEQSRFLSDSFLISYMKCWHSLTVYIRLLHILLFYRWRVSSLYSIFCSVTHKKERERKERLECFYSYTHIQPVCSLEMVKRWGLGIFFFRGERVLSEKKKTKKK